MKKQLKQTQLKQQMPQHAFLKVYLKPPKTKLLKQKAKSQGTPAGGITREPHRFLLS